MAIILFIVSKGNRELAIEDRAFPSSTRNALAPTLSGDREIVCSTTPKLCDGFAIVLRLQKSAASPLGIACDKP
jgi:hypothetical protein